MFRFCNVSCFLLGFFVVIIILNNGFWFIFWGRLSWLIRFLNGYFWCLRVDRFVCFVSFKSFVNVCCFFVFIFRVSVLMNIFGMFWILVFVWLVVMELMMIFCCLEILFKKMWKIVWSIMCKVVLVLVSSFFIVFVVLFFVWKWIVFFLKFCIGGWV